MEEQLISLIDEAQGTEIVTSYGADADTRISPRVVTAVYKVLETVMHYPPF